MLPNLPVTLAGVLRNYHDGRGWVVHENATHKSFGITSIATTDTEIIVYSSGVQGVITSIVVPDNNLVAAGVTAGVSGGGSASHITLVQAGSVVDPWTINTTTIPNSNLWILGCQF